LWPIYWLSIIRKTIHGQCLFCLSSQFLYFRFGFWWTNGEEKGGLKKEMDGGKDEWKIEEKTKIKRIGWTTEREEIPLKDFAFRTNCIEWSPLSEANSCTEPEGSLSCSQQFAVGQCHKPVQSSLRFPILSKIYFNSFMYTSRFSKRSVPFRVFRRKVYVYYSWVPYVLRTQPILLFNSPCNICLWTEIRTHSII
jgi:hypothetical protein